MGVNLSIVIPTFNRYNEKPIQTSVMDGTVASSTLVFVRNRWLLPPRP